MEHFDATTVSAFRLLAAVMGDKIAVTAVMREDVAQLPVSLCWKMFPSVWVNLKCLHATIATYYTCSSLMHTCVMYTAVCTYNACTYNQSPWACQVTHAGGLQSLAESIHL